MLSEKELGDLFDGLVANDLHKIYTHLLTGYVGNDKFLKEIKRIIKELRDANPNISYGTLKKLFCDFCDNTFKNFQYATLFLAITAQMELASCTYPSLL